MDFGGSLDYVTYCYNYQNWYKPCGSNLHHIAAVIAAAAVEMTAVVEMDVVAMTDLHTFLSTYGFALLRHGMMNAQWQAIGGGVTSQRAISPSPSPPTASIIHKMHTPILIM